MRVGALKLLIDVAINLLRFLLFEVSIAQLVAGAISLHFAEGFASPFTLFAFYILLENEVDVRLFGSCFLDPPDVH